MAHDRNRVSALVPLTGVVFVVLTVVALIIAGEPPDGDAPAGEVVEFWTDNDTVLLVGSILEALAAVSLIFFATGLRHALRKGEDEAGVLSTAALAGGIVAAAGIGVDAAIRFAAADLAEDADPVVIQTLNALWSDFFFPMVVGLATLILATSLRALQIRIIPKWLAWVGFVIFLAFFTPAGFISFIASGIWILIVSVLLWRQSTAVSPRVAEATL